MVRRDRKKERSKDRRDSTSTGLLIGCTVLLGALGVGAALLFGGDAKADEPAKKDEGKDEEKKDDDKPEDEPAPEQDDDNWGATPPGLRAEFERAEKAAGIPGLGRFMAVWAWGAFRAKKAPVSAAEAAAISAANPNWCLKCQNDDPDELKASADALDRVTLPKSQGGDYDKPWKMPKFAASWKRGSSALFDVLRGAQAHAGIHEGYTPLVDLDADVVLFEIDVQLYLGGWIVRRIVHREDLLVIKQGDPAMTWANVRACTATPVGYKALTDGKDTPLAKAAKQARDNCFMRATELGIDLSKLPQPIPWTWPGPKAYWERLGVDANVVVKQQKGGDDLVTLGALKGRMTSQVQAGAQAPLVVLLHGRDGNEDQLGALTPKDLPVRVLALRGAGADGKYKFYAPASTAPPAELATAVRSAADQVQAAIAAARASQPTTKVVVVGYSQGGSIAYELAARGVVDGVVVAAGFFPEPAYPTKNTPTRIFAVHGSLDKTVSLATGRAAFDSFVDAAVAAVAEFEEVPDGTHALATLADTTTLMLLEALE